MERISTGITALDNMLHGGFPERSTILIIGRPGTGKTILAHQIMFHNATPENKAIYLTTLSEPQVKIMKFQQEFSYFDLNKFQRSIIYHDLGSVLRKHGPAQTLGLIEELLKKNQPRLIIIDTIKSIADMIPSSTGFREFLLDLSLRLATWGCTALLLGEYSEENVEIRPESAIADGIIYLSGMEERKRQKRYIRILKMRGTGYMGGEIVFRISGTGIEVFPRLNPAVSSQVYKQSEGRISTGIKGLNEMMGGGVPRASTTLLSGPSGTGKTLLALYFIYAGLFSGEAAVYVTFEENPNQIIKTTKLLGLDLQQYLDTGQLHLMHVSPIELDVDEHIFKIQRLVQETGASRLVIDSISSFEIGITDKIKYTDHIWALTDFFKLTGVSVFLTHEMHDSARVSVLTKHGISFIADNLILLRFLEEGMDLKRYLRVVKMRGSNHLTEMRELHISRNGVVIGDRRF